MGNDLRNLDPEMKVSTDNSARPRRFAVHFILN